MTKRFSIFSFLIAVIFIACKNDIKQIRAATEDFNLPLQTSIDAEYTYTEDGKKRNILEAHQLDQYGGDSSYVVASGGFKMTFFDSVETQIATMTADSGIYFQEENKLIAIGNVLLKNTQNEMLETTELIFEQDSNRIFTDKPVSISTGDGKFFGKGLESNSSFTRYQILQPTGDFYIDENDESILSSPNGKDN
ncbi:MAG: LPS export ABC transporter periplasmic protein LptC [Flavobacteriales bacterium]